MASEGIKVNMTPPSPWGIHTDRDCPGPWNCSVTIAAQILGTDPAVLSDVLSCQASLSPELALRIEKAFGVGMDMLLRMQAWYDASQMRAPGARDQSREIRAALRADRSSIGVVGSAKSQGAGLRPAPTLFPSFDKLRTNVGCYSMREPPQARDTPPAVGSTIALMTAGLPLSNARWRAGLISLGSSTLSP